MSNGKPYTDSAKERSWGQTQLDAADCYAASHKFHNQREDRSNYTFFVALTIFVFSFCLLRLFSNLTQTSLVKETLKQARLS